MNKVKELFFGFWFRLAGWKIIGELPTAKKYLVIVAPHTSSWDFILGMAVKHIVGLHSDFLGKKALFNMPIVGRFMRSVGGHPVDRTKNSNMVDQVVSLFNDRDEFVVTLAPEGTRSFVPKWKTGFYHIAHKAGIPIAMVGFDYQKREVEFKELFYPTGDLEVDMGIILSYFRTVVGKYPELGTTKDTH
ncbi:MAG: 1-acyl-sn-glycerol-3-phosphate acyltransferase [Cyclobacteriaceae bacterium]|jgi:1-acyl-sn-glycerol-3-phosphate acyltransferase